MIESSPVGTKFILGGGEMLPIVLLLILYTVVNENSKVRI